MSTKYGRLLSGVVKRQVEELLDDGPAQQVSILEELALLRTHVARSVRMYSVATNAMHEEEAKSDDERDQERLEKLRTAVEASGELMATQLERVAKMANTAAGIEQGQRGLITPTTILVLMQGMLRQVEAVCTQEQMKLITAKLKDDRLSIPGMEKPGTSILPGGGDANEQIDEQVTLMDNTVPEAE